MKKFLVFVTCFVSKVALAGPCGTFELPKLYSSDATQFHYIWKTDAAQLLNPTNEFDPQLEQLATWVKTFAPLDQHELLDIQRASYEAAGEGYERLAARVDRVSKGKLGKLEKPLCLESYVMNQHMQKFPPQSSFPAEMLIVVLKNRSNPSKLTAFFSFGEGKAHYVSPPYSQSMWDQIAALIATNEWRPDFFSHSHPFMVRYEEAPHIGGTVAPSDEDADYYNQWMQLPEPQNYLRTRIVTPFNAIEFNKHDDLK